MAPWAVVPVKELDRAKQRLAPLVPPASRRALMQAMLEDVLAALAAAPGLAGIAVVTIDPAAAALAARYGARIVEDGARDGHTGAVTAAARRLAAEGCVAMLTLPGDVPLATPREIAALLAAHRPDPAFTIAPSHDERGSNAILVSPPEAVPFAFGDDSFRPHLAAAAARGIAPTVLRLPGIALDIDTPADLLAFMDIESQTRTRMVLDQTHLPAFSSWPGSSRPSTSGGNG
jgi:2-phospho-L-lactate/phosphoenolpyruvate guanylyltransferase